MSKILIAEDEAMLRAIAAETLEDAGYRVLQAGDGEAALELLKSNPDIQVLVSDVKMPRMDGYTLALAGLTMKPELQILMMTGYAQDPPAELLRIRMIQMLRKPFNLDDLCKKVGELLANPGLEY
jgi:two-component system cell cycle sensor histidine kinase/response regulator CckA